MPIINYLFKYWKTILVCVVIFILSTTTFDSVPKEIRFPHIDKLIHFLMFFGLGLVSYFEYKRVKCTFNYIFLFLIFVLYGGMIEIIQELFLKSRSGELIDWFSDILGLFFGVLLARSTQKFFINNIK